MDSPCLSSRVHELEREHEKLKKRLEDTIRFVRDEIGENDPRTVGFIRARILVYLGAELAPAVVAKPCPVCVGLVNADRSNWDCPRQCSFCGAYYALPVPKLEDRGFPFIPRRPEPLQVCDTCKHPYNVLNPETDSGDCPLCEASNDEQRIEDRERGAS